RSQACRCAPARDGCPEQEVRPAVAARVARPRMDATRENQATSIRALFADGPLGGSGVGVEPVEGRPPKTIDVPGAGGATYRYCLAEWIQKGKVAEYTFLYPV